MFFWPLEAPLFGNQYTYTFNLVGRTLSSIYFNCILARNVWKITARAWYFFCNGSILDFIKTNFTLICSHHDPPDAHCVVSLSMTHSFSTKLSNLKGALISECGHHWQSCTPVCYYPIKAPPTHTCLSASFNCIGPFQPLTTSRLKHSLYIKLYYYLDNMEHGVLLMEGKDCPPSAEV